MILCSAIIVVVVVEARERVIVVVVFLGVGLRACHSRILRAKVRRTDTVSTGVVE